jgi:hypothetical protein
LIPQLPLGKAHYILLCDLPHYSLNLLRAHAATSGDDLASDIFRYSSGAIERQEDGCFELSLGTFNLCFTDII